MQIIFKRFDPIHIFFDNEHQYFRGDLSNISAKAATMAATATDPDEIDRPIAQPPTMNACEFHSMMNVCT